MKSVYYLSRTTSKIITEICHLRKNNKLRERKRRRERQIGLERDGGANRPFFSIPDWDPNNVHLSTKYRYRMSRNSRDNQKCCLAEAHRTPRLWLIVMQTNPNRCDRRGPVCFSYGRRLPAFQLQFGLLCSESQLF